MRWLWLLIIPILIAYFFFDNLFAYKRAKKFKKLYIECIQKENTLFTECRELAIRLLKKAKIDDLFVDVPEHLGNYQVSKKSVSVFVNCLNYDITLQQAFLSKLNDAIGVFRYQISCAINPIKWVEFVFFLPKTMLTYFNVKNNTISNILQALYWVASITLIILQILGIINANPGES